MLLGPASIWDSGWLGVLPASVTADDVCLWPYSVGVLVKLVAFLGTLHWRASGADVGVGAISHVFLLTMGDKMITNQRFFYFDPNSGRKQPGSCKRPPNSRNDHNDFPV